MHEWALAESVVCTIEDESKSHALKRITRVIIRIGELQQIEADTFRLLVENVLKEHDLPIENGAIQVETEKCLFRCKVCGSEWGPETSLVSLDEDETEAIHFVPEIAHIYIRCPQCKSPDFDIIQGRGVQVGVIEGER